MIIVCGGIKGGSGKTTLASNLAVLRATVGRRVLAVDADEQETLADFTMLRAERHPARPSYTCVRLAGPAVRTEVLRLSPLFEDIIIDTGGRDTTSQRAALAVADVLIVPFVPRSFDLWTLEKVSALVGEMRQANPGLRALTILNRSDPANRAQDNIDTAGVLSEAGELAYLDCQIGNRKALSNAASQGLAVTEIRGQCPQSANEILMLYRNLFDGKMISSENQEDI